MLGTIVNAVAITVGAGIGILFRKGIPVRMSDTLMKGLGLCTLFLGITGSLGSENVLLLIISVVFGVIIGEAAKLEERLERLGKKIEERLTGISSRKYNGGKVSRDSHIPRMSLAEGFVSASLLFCVGALAIIGSLESGLTGEHGILFNKSMIDFVAAAIFASTLGIGVMLSAVSVLIYQGAITLFSQWALPLLKRPKIFPSF